MDGRHSRESGKLIHHPFQLPHLGHNRFRSFVDCLRRVGFVVLKLLRDALGGELNRRQRILDLVRDSPRGFIPCGELLRLHELCGVFDRQHPPFLPAG